MFVGMMLGFCFYSLIMLRIAKLLLCAATLLLLSGCWIPEQFDAKIAINKDGRYTLSYDGILSYAAGLAAAKKGELKAKDEEAFKKEAEKIAREPGFKKVDYLGKGRYKVLVEKSAKTGEATFFLNRNAKIISIQPQPDGTITISSMRLEKKDIRELTAIGGKVEGTLTVTVASGTKVIKHNAQSEPSSMSLFGSSGYKWKISNPEETPFISVKPAS